MLYQPTNLAGPSRPAQIQQMVMNAAQNVLKRQRARQAIQSAATGAANTAAQGGQALRIQGSSMHPMVGTRGQIQTPNGITADQLAAMTRAAAQSGHLPDGRAGGVFGGGGGGFDFGSLRSPSDPRQGGAATQATAAVAGGGQVQPSPPDGSAPHLQPVPNPQFPGQTALANDSGQFLGDAGMNAAGGGLAPGVIPLGNGQFYDPTTDSITSGIAHPGTGGQGRFL